MGSEPQFMGSEPQFMGSEPQFKGEMRNTNPLRVGGWGSRSPLKSSKILKKKWQKPFGEQIKSWVDIWLRLHMIYKYRTMMNKHIFKCCILMKYLYMKG
jgi:hypothetical protein